MCYDSRSQVAEFLNHIFPILRIGPLKTYFSLFIHTSWTALRYLCHRFDVSRMLPPLCLDVHYLHRSVILYIRY